MATQAMQESLYTTTSALKSYEYGNSSTPLFPADGFIRGEYDAAFGGEIGFGNVCSSSVKITVSGKYDFRNKKIDVSVSAGINTEKLGWFTVVENEQDGGNTTFTAYDGAYLLNRRYEPTVTPSDTGNYSTYGIVNDILKQCSDAEKYNRATLQSTLKDRYPATYIKGDITGYTCAEMLGFIAMLRGQNVCIDNQGYLQFVTMTENAPYVPGNLRYIPADYIYESGLKLGGSWKPASVVCQVGEDEDDSLSAVVNANGGFNLYIRNPFMTQTILNDMATTLRDYAGWETGSCSHFGGGFVRPGDVVPMKDAGGSTHKIIAANVHVEFDGGVKTEFSSSSSADDSTAAPGGGSGTSSSDIVSQVNRLEEKVKALQKATGKWTALPLASGITAYSSAFGASPLGVPAYIVSGGICHIVGSVNAAYNGSASTLLATLPAGARPASSVYALATCGGKRLARIFVNVSGSLRLEWIVNLSDGSNYTTSTWVEVNMEYPVSDVEMMSLLEEEELLDRERMDEELVQMEESRLELDEAPVMNETLE